MQHEWVQDSLARLKTLAIAALLPLLLLIALPGADAIAQDPPDDLAPMQDPDDDGARHANAVRLADEVAAREPRTLEDFRALEARIRAAAARTLPTVVGLIFEGPEAGAGSGTIISTDGWVLTAGHVGRKPGRPVRVLLADGTELRGRTAGQLLGPGEDAGLVKIEPEGRELPAAKLGSALALRVGDPLIVFGHPLGPELTPWRPPPLRVGRLVARDHMVLSIDAPLSPGDSGGPVFDLDGALVGVNSVASDRPDLNAAIAVDLAKGILDELKQEIVRGTYLEGGADEPGKPPRPPIQGLAGDAGESLQVQSRRRRVLLETLAPLADPHAISVVGVIVDSRDAGYGVFVDAAGHVLAKDSDLGSGVRRVDVLLPDGLTVRARRVASDPALDLALLETGANDADPMRFDGKVEDAGAGMGAGARAKADAAAATESASPPQIGDALITVGRGMLPVAVGHRSLVNYQAGASDNASRAYLGVSLRAPTAEERADIPGGVGQIVIRVQEGSGAAEAGIVAGDALLAIEGMPLDAPESAASQLRIRAPGDSVRVTVVHAGQTRTPTVRLQRPLWIGGPGNTGAPLSRRATGFGPVIVHDGIVPAENIGGPIIDSHGRVVGLNIARADRTKTYALPGDVVQASIDRMLAKIARGEVEAPVDSAKGVQTMRFESSGTAWLPAVRARVLGPTNALRGEDDLAAIEGWTDPEDGAVWRLQVPAPGRYDLALDASGIAGGGVDVIFGNEQMSTRVPVARTPMAYGRVRIGEVFLDEAGAVTVRVHPLGKPRGALMSLRGITVDRIDLLRTFERSFPYMRLRDLERFNREHEREQRRLNAETPAAQAK